MRGQCIDLPPDSVPLPLLRPAHQLWPMSGLCLLDVYGSNVKPFVCGRITKQQQPQEQQVVQRQLAVSRLGRRAQAEAAFQVNRNIRRFDQTRNRK